MKNFYHIYPRGLLQNFDDDSSKNGIRKKDQFGSNKLWSKDIEEKMNGIEDKGIYFVNDKLLNGLETITFKEKLILIQLCNLINYRQNLLELNFDIKQYKDGKIGFPGKCIKKDVVFHISIDEFLDKINYFNSYKNENICIFLGKNTNNNNEILLGKNLYSRVKKGDGITFFIFLLSKEHFLFIGFNNEGFDGFEKVNYISLSFEELHSSIVDGTEGKINFIYNL